MAIPTTLHALFEQSARRFANRPAVMDSGATLSYAELDQLADRLRDRLVERGVGIGDRVGLCLRKSADSVASILAVLKAGAAYVPVGPEVPASRNAFVFSDCQVRIVVTEEEFAGNLRSELGRHDCDAELLVLDKSGGGSGLGRLLDEVDGKHAATPAPPIEMQPEALAYLLYTSGSTGKPKGVMLSHRNAVSFVEWCSKTFQPNEMDRFSSHAPFHFDLSILDIYVTFRHGALLVLIGEALGKEPQKLGPYISESKISVWYSTPSVLTLLTEYGRISDFDFSSLRMILFAGEVFPIKHLRELTKLLPGRRYFNLYGPTETNVCTFFELPTRIPDGQSVPFPIGKTCSHLRSCVLDSDGQEVEKGHAGELCIAGPAVMRGYWNLPNQTEAAFVEGARGDRWYRTGDIVAESPSGDFVFQGRIDRMIKRRGFRVELGEIEATLYQHENIAEAAVVALTDDEEGVRVVAFISSGEARLSIIELKRFCAERLPVYMTPDLFRFLKSLPKTSTDKIDYESLKQLARQDSPA